jgi:hypothetical protein
MNSLTFSAMWQGEICGTGSVSEDHFGAFSEKTLLEGIAEQFFRQYDSCYGLAKEIHCHPDSSRLRNWTTFCRFFKGLRWFLRRRRQWHCPLKFQGQAHLSFFRCWGSYFLLLPQKFFTFDRTGLAFFGEDDDDIVHSNITDRLTDILPDVQAHTWPFYQVSSLT